MTGPPSRRAFLASCGLLAVAGCTAPTGHPTETSDADAGDTNTTQSSDAATASEQASIDLPDGAAWPTFGGDAANTGRRDSGTGPSAPTTKAWRTDVDGIFTMPGPVVADGVAYVGSGKRAYAVDALTGTPRWDADLGSFTHHFSPSVTANGVLFAAQSNITSGGDAGSLTSFAADGSERWAREFTITTSPSAVDGTVFVGESTDDGAVLRTVADADGSDGWQVAIDADRVRGALAVVDGVVYATATGTSGDTGVVVALEAESGDELWSRPLDAGARAAPAVQDGTVYVQADDGRLFALDAETGEPSWTSRLGEKAATAPALSEDTLVGMVENQLVGVDLADGAVRWRTDIGYTLINGVSIANGRAYVGGGHMTAVDVEDGTVAWDQPVPGTGGGFGAPVAVGNAVFVGVCIKQEPGDPYDDYLYAYI